MHLSSSHTYYMPCPSHSNRWHTIIIPRTERQKTNVYETYARGFTTFRDVRQCYIANGMKLCSQVFYTVIENVATTTTRDKKVGFTPSWKDELSQGQRYGSLYGATSPLHNLKIHQISDNQAAWKLMAVLFRIMATYNFTNAHRGLGGIRNLHLPGTLLTTVSWFIEQHLQQHAGPSGRAV